MSELHRTVLSVGDVRLTQQLGRASPPLPRMGRQPIVDDQQPVATTSQRRIASRASLPRVGLRHLLGHVVRRTPLPRLGLRYNGQRRSLPLPRVGRATRHRLENDFVAGHDWDAVMEKRPVLMERHRAWDASDWLGHGWRFFHVLEKTKVRPWKRDRFHCRGWVNNRSSSSMDIEC